MNNELICFMAFSFKHFFFLVGLLLSIAEAGAQVSVNLLVKPPFTPFISDYTKPERLEDVSISLFNSSGKDLRLKFSFSLSNRAQGIEIALRGDLQPAQVFELKANEFRFLTLSDLSGLYGRLDQHSFTIRGANIENLILDGTIPDGTYEICMQAFDFDAPGLTVPMSQGSPTGCFTFDVSYSDPPTDIRLNSDFLNYTYGGEVPQFGFNSLAGQNHSIQFTPPTMIPGALYEYTLHVYDETAFNPNQMPEARMKETVTSLIPYLSKTSSTPFFIISPGDPPLEFGKNYFLLIEARDLNGKTVFKNKGFSTLKAFRLIDTKPVLVEPPFFTLENCGQTVLPIQVPLNVQWDYADPAFKLSAEKGELITDIRIVSLSAFGIVPDLFEERTGQLILDTSLQNPVFGTILTQLSTSGRFGSEEENADTRLVFAIRNRIRPGSPLASSLILLNEGKCRQQCEINISRPNGFTPEGQTILTAVYPVNGDTLPFNYPPVLISAQNLNSRQKIVFTQFNSPLEPVESNKYLKLSTDPEFNTQLNGFRFDSTLNRVEAKLEEAGRLQLEGDFDAAAALIQEAGAILNQRAGSATVQIASALEPKHFPLGNGVDGKEALARQLFRYQGASQVLGQNPLFNYPNLSSFMYLMPYKNGISWTARVGVYDIGLVDQMGMVDYERKFRLNQFEQSDMQLSLLQQGYKTAGGRFSTGMGTPQLLTKNGQEVIAGKSLVLQFKPSLKPQKLLPPSPDNNESWQPFLSLGVAQQWNVEVSRTPDFSVLDTVISKKIIKQYRVSEGESEIIRDLYSQENIAIQPRDTGTVYWRVSWSNITQSDNPNLQERTYWQELGRQLANSQLAGEYPEFEGNADSFFFKRVNYRVSATDSFYVVFQKDTATIPKPNFELVYPAEGDTIPFYYPPVVVKKLPADTLWDFALSEFNSNLEPFRNINYYVFDSLSNAGQVILNASYDSSLVRNRAQFDLLAQQELLGEESGDFESLINQVAVEGNKNKYLQVRTMPSSELLPFGNSGQGKINLIQLLVNRNANLQILGLGSEDNERQNIGQLIYFQPTKSIAWQLRLAYYTSAGTPSISLDSFELAFRHNQSLNNLSPSLQNGQATLQGGFQVGMKTPELVSTFNGRQVNKGNIEISFKPSAMPAKVFPENGNGEVWNSQWSRLFAAQQWNIEVAADPRFDSIIMVKSKAIIESYSVPGSQGRVMNDFYLPRNEKLDSLPQGKFYYRITWSNPTDVDTTQQLHKDYFANQLNLMALGQLLIDSTTANELDRFDFLKRINYRFSAVDSFEVVDSLIASSDTPVCGLGCVFPMSGINRQASDSLPKLGQVMKVGQFEMTLTAIRREASGQFSGEGKIKCSLFPRPLAVGFNRVQFNDSGRLISGEVRAQYQTSDLLGTVTNGTNTGIGLIDEFKNKLIAGAHSKVAEYYDFINSPACLLLDELSNEPVKLPIGLSKTVDNFPYTIALTDLRFTPERANLNAVSLVEFTALGHRQILGFGATDVCLNAKGLADITEGGALDLIGAVRIQVTDSTEFQILGRESDTSSVSGTRMIWDCNGFKQIDLKVSLELGRDLVAPMNRGLPSPGKVTAVGFASVASMQNWMLELDLNRSFEATLLPGFQFSARHLTLDFSHVMNPSTIQFPAGYAGTRGADWQGIYIGEFSMRLPDALSGGDTANGLQFTAQNMLMDPSGLTVSVGADNLLNLDSGALAGWKFSIERFSFEVVSNALSGSRLVGELGAPLFTEPFAYQLLLSTGRTRDSLNMDFSITNPETLSMPAWFASVNLDESSTIGLKGDVRNPNSWMLNANFNGEVAMEAEELLGLKDIRFGTLPFEGLKLRTGFGSLDSFRISLDKLGGMQMNRLVGGGSSESPTPAPVSTEPKKVGGFPVQITRFDFTEFNGKCLFEDAALTPGIRKGISMGLAINITEGGADGNGIGGQFNFGLFGVPKKEGQLWEMDFAGLNLDTIRVDAKLSGVVSVVGGIAIVANDPVYGNAISGIIQAKFEPTIAVGVSAIFGEKNNMRYWMVGAGAEFPPIPIDFSANVIYANAIKGEAWYKMSRIPGDAAAVSGTPRLGQSFSGASFVPDNNQLFGFGAMLGITGPPGSPLFGELGLFAEISNFGSLSKLTMEGNMWMTTPDKTTAPVFIRGITTIDVSRKKFIGNLSALVNVGNGAVRGRTPQTIDNRTVYYAGMIDLLVDMSSLNPIWHIRMGNPFLENGRMGFGFYQGNKSLFEAGGYLLMGNDLPSNLPPIQTELAKKLEQAGLRIPSIRPRPSSNDFMVLMGVDANIPEKKIELGSFYAGMELQFALDGLLEPNAPNCNGRDGIQGWYMTGRAYAYSNIALGMHVDLPVFKGDLVVAEMNAGMLLNAGMMNPYTFNGQFSANFTALGGLIQGSRRFDFELNEDPKCVPSIPKQTVNINAIVAQVSPAPAAENVMIGVEPYIELNFPLDSIISYTLSGRTRPEQIRVRQEYYRIRQGQLSTSPLVIATTKPAEGRLVSKLIPQAFLKAGNTVYRIEAKYYVERFVYSATTGTTGTWTRTMANGRTWDTTLFYTFTTEAIAAFSPEYIVYSTPLAGENYFKKGEFTEGKIVCTRSDVQSAFFSNPPSTPEMRELTGYYIWYGQFVRAGDPSDTFRTPLRFAREQILFNLPPNLGPDKLYQFRLIREKIPGTPLQNTSLYTGTANTFTSGSLSGGQIMPQEGPGGNDPVVSPQSNPEIFRKLREAKVQGDPRVMMHSFVFGVSKYANTQMKLQALQQSISKYALSSSTGTTIELITEEPFENYEVKGFYKGTNLILAQKVHPVVSNSALDDNNWLTGFYRPKVFKAGDSLWKKRPYVAQFFDISKQLKGVNVQLDDHIKAPLPTNSYFGFDLRMADTRLNSFKPEISQVFLNSSVSQSITGESVNTNLTIDPQTGQVSSGGLFGSGYEAKTISGTSTATIELGTRLNLFYDFIPMASKEHARAVLLANLIITRAPSTWYYGLSVSEIQLVSRLYSGGQPFVLPASSDSFVAHLRPLTQGTATAKKVYISRLTLESATITRTFGSTSFSTFTR
ncbi:MAG: hypothetical protein EP332_13590 [Bacteroidetes bacterium]|nr:MAG: hypothetical protein EP332_13590 [Bacteroidota bacterium]